MGCALAATILGFGSEVFSSKGAHEDLGREPQVLPTRLPIYLWSSAVILVFRCGWRGFWPPSR